MQFSLHNIAGGSGGTYRLRADGTLSRRAIRALSNTPFGGWLFSGRAAATASAAWRDLQDRAHDAGLFPWEV